MKTDSFLIKTPEGVTFSQSLAGPVTRFLAWFIDFMTITVIAWSLGSVLGLLGVISSNVATAAFTLSYFAVSFGYGIFLEWMWRGQTI